MGGFGGSPVHRRRWLLVACCLALGLIVLIGDWPLPESLRQSVIATVSARLQRPLQAAEARWQPLRGLVLRDAVLQTDWPTARAAEAWALGLFPAQSKQFLLVDVELHGGRDETGTLQVPWPRGEAVVERPERIEIRGGECHWTDARLGWNGVFHQLAATLEPARRRGALTALLGETEPSPVSARWEGGAGRITADSVPLWRLPWLPEPLTVSPAPLAMTLDWRELGESMGYQAEIRQGELSLLRLELETPRRDELDSAAFAGRLTDESLDVAIRGTIGPDRFELAVAPVNGVGARVRGQVTARKVGGRWSSRYDFRTTGLPGFLLDPWLRGARLRGPVNLDLARAAPAAPIRVALDARNGRLEGVRGFANFARRTGLGRFNAPVYQQLQLRATISPSRISVSQAFFEGGGLRLAFHGDVSAKVIAGRLRALFSEEIVRASPELSRYRHFLDTENGRAKVDFIVSGHPDAPDLDPILPSAPVMLFRGVRELFTGTFAVGRSAIRQGLSTIFD